MGAFLSVKCPPHRQNIVNDDMGGRSKPIQLIFKVPETLVFLGSNAIGAKGSRTPDLSIAKAFSLFSAVSITEPVFVSVSAKKPWVSRLKRLYHYNSFSIKVKHPNHVFRPQTS
jgi:hypothetical protein